MKTLTDPPIQYSSLKCSAEKEQILQDIEDKHLSCLNENDTNNEMFLLQPDVRFRKIS